MGVRGGWGELVWWGKEGTDVGEGGKQTYTNFCSDIWVLTDFGLKS